MYAQSPVHVYVGRGPHVHALYRHRVRLREGRVRYLPVSIDSKNIPRVRTPKVVDFPLSTFPTTAHRTSGVKDTFGGGKRRSNDIRGCPVLTSNKIDAFHALATSASKTRVLRNTFPPTSSTVFVIRSLKVSMFSIDRGVANHPGDSSVRSPTNNSV